MRARKSTEPEPAKPAAALSLGQSGKIANQSVQTMRRLVRRGELPHCRIGRRVVVLEEDLYAFLRARRVAATA